MSDKVMQYTAFADFEAAGQKVKQGEVFAPPADWQEVPNNEPGNQGCKFMIAGEIYQTDRGQEQQFRAMILPVNKG